MEGAVAIALRSLSTKSKFMNELLRLLNMT
jgi:hypothetical protein